MTANELSDEGPFTSSGSSNNPYGYVKVAGIQYECRHIVALSLQPGAELVLLREYHPKHPNAIRVNTIDDRQLGYVERKVADELAGVFDAYGKPVRAEIVAIIGDDPTSFDYQVRICVDVPPLTKSASSVRRGELVNDRSLRLTKEQQDIIDHPLGYHAQVLAVAGSGKTTTMVYRIKHLVEHFGIQPASICVLMFNRRVRKQFQEKLAKLNLQLNSVHTFHSFGREVIQKAINAGMGVQAEEWTEDKEEQVRLTIYKAIRNLRIDPESIDIEDAMQCVSLWKGALIPPLERWNSVLAA